MCRVLKSIFKEHLKYDIEENSESDTTADDNYTSVQMRAKNSKFYGYTDLELI